MPSHPSTLSRNVGPLYEKMMKNLFLGSRIVLLFPGLSTLTAMIALMPSPPSVRIISLFSGLCKAHYETYCKVKQPWMCYRCQQAKDYGLRGLCPDCATLCHVSKGPVSSYLSLPFAGSITAFP